MDKKLSTKQIAVLKFLYEHKEDSGNSISEIVAATGLSGREARRTLRELTELGLIGGPKDLLSQSVECLTTIDPKFDITDPNYPAHIVLIASALSKADEPFLASELDYDHEFVAIIGSRLRSSGIWSGDKLAPERMDAWSDATAFFLDAAVATGDLVVVGGTTSDPQYQMSPAGLKRAAELVKSMKR